MKKANAESKAKSFKVSSHVKYYSDEHFKGAFSVIKELKSKGFKSLKSVAEAIHNKTKALAADTYIDVCRCMNNERNEAYMKSLGVNTVMVYSFFKTVKANKFEK